MTDPSSLPQISEGLIEVEPPAPTPVVTLYIPVTRGVMHRCAVSREMAESLARQEPCGGGFVPDDEWSVVPSVTPVPTGMRVAGAEQD